MRRPRRVVLLAAVTATLALLCCLGGVVAVALSYYTQDRKDPTDLSLGCGRGGVLDPDGTLPQVRPYGAEQVRNAAIIVNVGADLKIPPRGWVVAVATAMQESALTNLGDLGDRNDHDSLGLFQQRPSAGWGTPAQIMNPVYASTKFYEKLRTIGGWETMPVTEAAQAVQISAYPDAYAKHVPLATRIVDLLADGASRAVGNSLAMVCAGGGRIAAGGWTVPLVASVGSGFRTPERPTHQGVDLIVDRNTPVRSVTDGVVSIVKCDETNTGALDCDRDGWPGKGGCGWMVEVVHAGNVMTRYCHLVRRPPVRSGQSVRAGQVIGLSGTSGNSSGPHLHFEVHLDNDRSSAGAVDPVRFMDQHGAPLDGRS